MFSSNYFLSSMTACMTISVLFIYLLIFISITLVNGKQQLYKQKLFGKMIVCRSNRHPSGGIFLSLPSSRWREEREGTARSIIPNNLMMVSEKRPAKHFKWQSSKRAALWRRAGVMIR